MFGIEGWIELLVLFAVAPLFAGLFLLLGWLRWWIGAVVLVALVLVLASAKAGAVLSEVLLAAIIAAFAAVGLAVGAWLDRLLRREWGIVSGRPVQRIPFLRPLYPRALDAVPAVSAALLSAWLVGYAMAIAVLPLNLERGAVAHIIRGFVAGVFGALYFGAPLGTVAVLLFGAFLVMRDLRILNLPWSAAAGALIGLGVVSLLNPSPMFALSGAAVGIAGGTAGYLELRRRVARYAGPAPSTPAEGAPLPRLVLAVLAAAGAVADAIRFTGSLVVSGYRAACAAMGGTSRARAIAALSLALAGAVGVFAAFGRSSVLADGFSAEDVALPATVGAAIVALLAYLATSAVVARLRERAAQQVALASLVVAVGGIAILRDTLFA